MIEGWTHGVAGDPVRWDERGLSVGVRTGVDAGLGEAVYGVDVDVNDPDVRTCVEALGRCLGRVGVRGRPNSTRVMLVFLGPPGLKARGIRLPGLGDVRLWTTGQQFVASGKHPSGVSYEWHGGVPCWDELAGVAE